MKVLLTEISSIINSTFDCPFHSFRDNFPAILNDLLFDINEIVEFEDVMTPEYASVLTTNENPVKDFFENDIFEQADKQLTQQIDRSHNQGL